MHKITKTALSHIIEIPEVRDEGYLSFAEEMRSIPFPIKRIYYIYGVYSGAVRGKHAHKETKQILFCIKGSVIVKLDNGFDKEEVILTKPNVGIILDTMMWHEMHQFSKDAVLLILASDYYDENDYIRDYHEFLSSVRKKEKLNNRFYKSFFNAMKSMLW